MKNFPSLTVVLLASLLASSAFAAKSSQQDDSLGGWDPLAGVPMGDKSGIDTNGGGDSLSKFGYGGECGIYANMTTVKDPSLFVRACEMGRQTALEMARRYAGSQGRFDGYRTGYSYGLYEGIRNPSYWEGQSAATAGAQAGVYSGEREGHAAGVSSGSRDGDSSGKSDAIKRFRTAVNSGTQPDLTEFAPNSSYTGATDGWRDQNYAFPSEQQAIRDYYTAQSNGYPYRYSNGSSYIGIYGNPGEIDSQYFSMGQPQNSWDMWKNDGRFSFDYSNALDSDRCWSNWSSGSNNWANRYEYGQLDATISIPNPGGEDAVSGQLITPRDVFQMHFKRNYRRWAPAFYREQFRRAQREGRREGLQIGNEIGLNLIYRMNQRQSYNQAYQAKSAQGYAQGLAQSYHQSFTETVQYYVSRPVLEIEFLDVVGTVDDGILQPGEKIKVAYRVTNLGGVASPLAVTLAGAIQDATVDSSETATPYSRKDFTTTAPIARVSVGAKIKNNASFTLIVNNQSAQSRAQTIHNQVEVMSVSARTADLISGNATVDITLKNVSTLESAGGVQTVIRANNGSADIVRELGKIAAGAQTIVTIPLAQIDPITILNHSAQVSTRITMNNADLDQNTAAIETNDRSDDAAKYFAYVVTDRAGAYIPAGVAKDTRAWDLIWVIDARSREEAKNINDNNLPNAYKLSPDTTVLGKVLKWRKDSSGMSTDSSAQKYWVSVAQELYDGREQFGGGFLGIGGSKRDAFKDLTFFIVNPSNKDKGKKSLKDKPINKP